MTLRPLLLLSLAGLLAAGCSRGERPVAIATPAPEPVEADTGWTGREQVGEAIALLNQGEPEKARKLLARVLKRQPGDTIAAKLLAQVDGDPAALLPAGRFPYRTKDGDSMSGLADRFLGDPLMFYALARLNGIAAPGTLEAGSMIEIPGTPPRPAVATPKPKRPAPGATAPARASAAAPTAPAAPSRDPARANRLRAAALAQMNKGAIERAVPLLRQAAAADPANALVRRDLTRALRIRQTVRAR